ncbi:MAG: tetratricopeptide repeat protein [Streptosporangiaceae bacterium]
MHRLLIDPSAPTQLSEPEGHAAHPILGLADAHRRPRGPYTGGGDLLRQIVPALLPTHHDLLQAHDVEIRAVAPELRDLLPGTRETLTSLASTDERTRFYPGAYTLRVAHGLADLLTELVAELGPRTVLFTRIGDADPTDVELLSVLWRRADPAQLQLVLVTDTETLPDPLGKLIGPSAVTRMESARIASAPDGTHWATWYVSTDCTSTVKAAREAYAALPPVSRARLHDERADRLEATGEFSWRLGAIPYHRERGADPTAAGFDALHFALEHCVMMGFYHAALDLGERCAALVDWTDDPERRWRVTAKVCTALTALGRADEAATEYELARMGTTLPGVHIQSAYGQAMLYTRFYDLARRDHRRARAWINTAIALSSLLPDDEGRLFNLTFQENGLALIAMHLGDPEEALALIAGGLRRLDAELGPGTQTLHRSVLRYNLAQLLGRLGRTQEAIAEYDRAIAADPNHSEYHLDRAELHRRGGDAEAALADYAAAIEVCPPYPEPYYNRADLQFELGDIEAAVRDLTRVIDLAPTMADAWINRASAYCQLGRFAEAMHDVAAGLRLEPDSAYLHCLHGSLLLGSGELEAADEACRKAVHLDPTLAGAWANLGTVAHARGDTKTALACLDRALEIEPNPDFQHNRELLAPVP